MGFVFFRDLVGGSISVSTGLSAALRFREARVDVFEDVVDVVGRFVCVCSDEFLADERVTLLGGMNKRPLSNLLQEKE